MTSPSVITKKSMAYLKRLGNPYAKLSLQEEQLELIAPEPSYKQKREYFKKLENPQAHGEIFGYSDETQGAADPRPNEEGRRSRGGGKLSKQGFQTGCGRIFKFYVPPSEGQALRPQYRQFIIRNEDRTPEQRFRLLEELKKYDISTSGNFMPHFNREQELLTVGKLQEIERSALVDILLG